MREQHYIAMESEPLVEKTNFTNTNTVLKIRRLVKERVILPSDTFRGHEKEKAELLGLIERTVTIAESNSALLVGPRGCGKTTLLNSVLDKLCDLIELEKHCLVVKLNGFIHVNDNVALWSAVKQLGLENVVGDRVFGSFSENLMFLFESLKSGSRERSKAVLFVIDEFQLFCRHHNQTLLYNLFDIVQSNQAPICVIGMTCRLDVVELLEKRVKSRFSHRQIHIFPGIGKDGMAQIDLFIYLLRLEDTDTGEHLNKKQIAQWNKHIESLAEHPIVKSMLLRMFDIDVGEAKMRALLMKVVCKLSPQHPEITVSDLTRCYQHLSKDSATVTMHNLSVVEMCLLISAKHHTDIFDNQPFNFEAVLARYLKFLRQNCSTQTTSRPVIMKAFEHLMCLDLIGPIGSQTAQKEYRMCQLLVLPHQVDDAVKSYKHLPTVVEQWAKSSLQ